MSRPIDAVTGTVRTDGGDEFGPHLSRAEFLARDGADARPNNVNGPFASWVVRRAIGGEAFAVDVMFEGEAILSVEMTLERDDLLADWQHWSEEAEGRRRAEHGRWLREACGIVPPVSGRWGALVSDLDGRTGWSSICIRFGEMPAAREPRA
jgi:hypothetical protein